jgi:hypothetical protein
MLCLLALSAGPAAAHEIRPAIVDVVVDSAGPVSVVVTASLEAMLAGIGPEHGDTSRSPRAATYDRLRGLSAGELRSALETAAPSLLAGMTLSADRTPVALALAGSDIPDAGDLQLARISIIRLTGAVPGGAAALSWRYGRALGDSVIRVRDMAAAEPRFSAYVAGGGTSEPILLRQLAPQSLASVFLDYVGVGFRHIVPKGLDHILFVVGLFLLNARLSPLLIQVTGFTVAHSLTLALGMLDIVRLPADIVEPLIAASIVYVAVENMITGQLRRWRPLVVFGFGLLHGLGFAGVLTELGLPAGQFAAGLIAFNVGVELGQLTVIGLCFLAVGLWFGQRAWYRRAVVIPSSAVIAAVAGFWFMERTGLIT